MKMEATEQTPTSVAMASTTQLMAHTTTANEATVVPSAAVTSSANEATVVPSTAVTSSANSTVVAPNTTFVNVTIINTPNGVKTEIMTSLSKTPNLVHSTEDGGTVALTANNGTIATAGVMASEDIKKDKAVDNILGTAVNSNASNAVKDDGKVEVEMR